MLLKFGLLYYMRFWKAARRWNIWLVQRFAWWNFGIFFALFKKIFWLKNYFLFIQNLHTKVIKFSCFHVLKRYFFYHIIKITIFIEGGILILKIFIIFNLWKLLWRIFGKSKEIHSNWYDSFNDNWNSLRFV